jgi:hypothetical protein
MNNEEFKIVCELIEREIDVFVRVKERVNKKDHWVERIKVLEEIKEKLKTKIELNQNEDD